MNIKDFANYYKCSLGSLYNKVKRNRDKLQGHIDDTQPIMELDDYAMDFLMPKEIKALLEQDKEMRTLQTTVREQEKTLNRLKSELSELKEIKNEISEKLETLKVKYEESENKNNALKEEIENLKTENEELKKNQKRKLF